MADNTTINTRIQLKNASHEAWESSVLPLLAGEFAFDLDKKYIKVGDSTGSKTWKELDSIHLPSISCIDGFDPSASDTNTIYKMSALTGENAGKIAFLSADGTVDAPVWESIFTFDADTNTNTQYKIESKGDNTWEFRSKELTDDMWLLESTIDLNYLSDAISDEISRAEDAEKTISVKLDQEITDRETAIANLEKNAALSVENLSSTVDGWLTDPSKGYVASAVTDDNKIATIADVAGLSGCIHIRGVDDTFLSGDGTTVPSTPWYDAGNKPSEGDVIINTSTSKEFLFTGQYSEDTPESGKWHELGDEGLYATKAELNAAVQELEAADAALAASVEDEADARDAADQDLQNQISNEATARAAADDSLQTAIGDEEQARISGDEALDQKIEAETQERENADQEIIDSLTAYVKDVKIGDTSLVSDQIASLGGIAISSYSDVTSALENDYSNLTVELGDLATKNTVGTADIDAGAVTEAKLATELATKINGKADLTALNALDERVQVVENNYLSAVQFNGVTATIEDHAAIFDSVIFNCGNAE